MGFPLRYPYYYGAQHYNPYFNGGRTSHNYLIRPNNYYSPYLPLHQDYGYYLFSNQDHYGSGYNDHHDRHRREVDDHDDEHEPNHGKSKKGKSRKSSRHGRRSRGYGSRRRHSPFGLGRFFDYGFDRFGYGYGLRYNRHHYRPYGYPFFPYGGHQYQSQHTCQSAQPAYNQPQPYAAPQPQTAAPQPQPYAAPQPQTYAAPQAYAAPQPQPYVQPAPQYEAPQPDPYAQPAPQYEAPAAPAPAAYPQPQYA